MIDKDALALALERRKRKALQKVFQDQNTLALCRTQLTRAETCLITGQIAEAEFDADLLTYVDAVRIATKDAAIARGALLETEEGDARKRS
jgi:hypothetical protein